MAPGIELDEGHFRLSLGYQGTIVGNLDGFAHYYQLFDGSNDWTFFAGLQLHVGGGGSRPFDLVMPHASGHGNNLTAVPS